MNYSIAPKDEYQMMQDFFLNGGTLSSMPPELLRVRSIWKRADELVRKYPYYNNEKIANHLLSDMPEMDMCISTAKKHVTEAKKYFNFCEKESPETHKRILLEICYKQIAILEKLQIANPLRANNVSKTIEQWSNRIASLSGAYDKEETSTEERQGDLYIVFSDKELDFPDIPDISDKELYKVIDDVTDKVSISTSEKKKLINKDVKGNIFQ